MDYSAIFFDWDGVITDSINIKADAFAELYRGYGPEIEKKVVDYHFLNSGISRFEKIKYFHREFLRKDINEAELISLGNQFSDIVFDAVVCADFIPGAIETLQDEYARGTNLFVVTGTPTDEMCRIAEARGLSRYFSRILGSPGNKTEIIARLISEFTLKKRECLMIGDAMEDYRAAANNGIDFLGIVTASDSFRVEFPAGTTIRNEVRI